MVGLFRNYRTELLLFAGVFVALTFFSSQRFLRQSAAPHFVYQAKAWLDGRLDIDPQVLPNIEDWACVRQVNGVPTRCEGQLLATDKWFVSFPWFPAVVMLPFVAINGYQFNDTSFGVIIAALAAVLFFRLVRSVLAASPEGPANEPSRPLVVSLVLVFGTVFFYCAIRGEVWFSAEVMGVALTCLYAQLSIGAKRPVLAGVVFSMAVLTRTPLVFSGVFFVMEALCPTPGTRIASLKKAWSEPAVALRPLLRFALGALPLAATAVAYNLHRFGRVTEFGHAFLFNNRVNVDIDRFGLFHPAYLARNLDAAFFKMPLIKLNPLNFGFDFHGLSLLLTLPLLVLLVWPAGGKQAAPRAALAASVVPFTLRLLWGLGGTPAALSTDIQDPAASLGKVIAIGLLTLAAVVAPFWVSYRAKTSNQHPLTIPALVTVAATAVPGFLYQNDGYAQFGFRFSLDYTPYLLLLFAVSGWALSRLLVRGLLALGVLVNFWGAVAFRGYTELVRGW